MAISVDMVEAIKVQFIRPIFEDDFPEKGMVAWLVDIEWDELTQCYNLWFDFTEFEAENEKYFKETYYANRYTESLPKKTQYTAKEAGMYTPKYSVYFSLKIGKRDDAKFPIEISHYIRNKPLYTVHHTESLPK
jgi:hypothetical protein